MQANDIAPGSGCWSSATAPSGRVQEIADAVLYLDGAGFVSGEILHVDGGAHAGKW